MSGTERMKKREEKLRKEVEGPCVRTLQESFGGNLRSVIAYGSFAGGHFVPGNSDVNLLVILDSSNPEQIESFGRKGKRLIRRLNVTPLILTKAEFISSADVFPIEYTDIHARHKVLMGEDLTASLALHKKNLRHQLEDRFRGAVISLRKLITAAGGNERLLGRQLKTWVGPLHALFRGLLSLRFLSEKPAAAAPTDALAVLNKVKETFTVDTGPLVELVGFRKGAAAGARRLSYAVLSALEELISAVDRYRT
jgi:predicted nucleotidyltransferase